MLSPTLIFSLLAIAQAQSDPSLANVTQAFSQAQIVPNVVSSFSPAAGVGITFTDPASMMPLNVTPGVLLTMEQTSMPPQFSITSPAPSVVASITYVLALIDPDAPTPQNTSESQFRHFLGGDFVVDPTAADPTILVNSSAALTEFFPPTPPAGSDPHRYILLMYVQSDGFDTMAPSFLNDSTPRNNFNLSSFVTALNLGEPVGGNFFLVGPDNNSSSTGTSSSSAVSDTGFPSDTSFPSDTGLPSGIASGLPPTPTDSLPMSTLVIPTPTNSADSTAPPSTQAASAMAHGPAGALVTIFALVLAVFL